MWRDRFWRTLSFEMQLQPYAIANEIRPCEVLYFKRKRSLKVAQNENHPLIYFYRRNITGEYDLVPPLLCTCIQFYAQISFRLSHRALRDQKHVGGRMRMVSDVNIGTIKM